MFVAGMPALISTLMAGAPGPAVPKADNATIGMFELLKSPPPSIVHRSNPAATAEEKSVTDACIRQRLLVTKEGKGLVRDLVAIQQKQKAAAFSIQFHFGVMPNGKAIRGFTDNLEDDEETLKKDMKMYVAYEPAVARDITYPVERDSESDNPEDSDVGDTIRSGASRMSLTLYHELLHVWFMFQQFPGVTFRSGHNGEETLFDTRFISRIRAYRKEIKELEATLRIQ
jgi:hypothetical protein